MDQVKVNQMNKSNRITMKMHRKVRKCKYELMSLLLFILMTGVSGKSATGTDRTSVQNDVYYFEVKENTADNRLIGQVNLMNEDRIYRFVSGPEFRFDSSTGRIYTTNHTLDRERQQFYNLIILSNQPQSTNPIQVKIKVLDEIDNRPFWPNDDVNRQISFSEMAPIGAKIIIDTAIDLDEDSLRYELMHCTEFEMCSCDLLNSTTGVNSDKSVHKPFKLNFNANSSILNLELIERLDREIISNYQCKVCAFDLKNQSNSINLNISIKDVNDCSPVFERSNYSTTLNHNLRKGDLIIQVKAHDLDEPGTPNSKLIYSLHNENNLVNSNYDNVEDFYINKTTGTIHISHDGLPVHCTLDNNQMNNQLTHLNSQYSNSQSNALKSACVFTVVCEDQGNPKQQSKAYVTIYQSSTDNLHVPEIKLLYFNHRFAQYAILDQNAIQGEAVAGVSVFDADNGPSGQTSLEIVSGNELEHFFLDSEFSSTGSYVIRVSHNFTLTNPIIRPLIYNLSIRAIDYGQHQLSSTQNLVIKINEISEDHKPTFNQQVYRVEILETAPIGSFVCLVNTVDQQSIVHFYSLSGNNSDYFHIDSSTGMVTLAKQIDREQINNLELSVYVRDTHLNSEWSSAKVLIQILDVNDNRPKVIKSANLHYDVLERNNTLVLEIFEGQKVNYEFFVIDEDLGENGSVTVELLYNYRDLFYLNTTSFMNRKEKIVHLHSTQELDYEVTKRYELIILMSDQGTPKQSSQFKIEIKVQDQDDQPVLVYPKHYFLNLNSVDKGALNSIQIQTIDADKATPTKYFFNFNNNHKNLNFVNSLATIDELSGIIMLKNSINFDTFPKYLPFNVTCDSCDRLNQQATIHLYLNVESNKSALHTDQTVYIDELSETRSVFDLNKLFDIDHSSHLIIVDGDKEQTFSINNRQLMLIKQLDHSRIPEYNLTLCEYTNDHFKVGKLQIKVKNENNRHPQFERSFDYLEMMRDSPLQMSIYRLNALDFDDFEGEVSSNIVYEFTTGNQLIDQQSNSSSLIQNGNYMFVLNKNQLELNVNLFERKISSNDDLTYLYSGDCVYLVSIRVRDLNVPIEPTVDSLMNLYIKINEPTLDKSELFDKTLELKRSFYELNIEESKPINSRLMKFELSYHDQLNGLLTFEFVNDENNLIRNQFGLFPDGQIYLKNKLDREQKEKFSFQVAIGLKSVNQTNQEKLINVLVHVIDNNDNAPKFEKEFYQFYVDENAPANTPVGRLHSTDSDLGLNALINYNLLANNEFSGLVGLDSKTGQLYMKAPVDYETIKLITFEVEAEDQPIYERRLKSRCKVQIKVQAINDCAPCFEIYDPENGNYLCSRKLKQQISIMENWRPNTTIHEFKVKDQDTTNDELKFTLMESEFSSYFHLDSLTGRLKLVKNLDREISERIDLLIKVDDGRYQAFNRLIIKIESMNDLSILNTNSTDINLPDENVQLNVNFNSTDTVFNAPYDSTIDDEMNERLIRVKENERIKTTIFDLSSFVTDFDVQFNLLNCTTLVDRTYRSIEPSNYPFLIESSSGKLILNRELDREKEQRYQITFSVSGLTFNAIDHLDIVVTDVNDCSPVFSKSYYTFNVSESTKNRTIIGKVEASDDDLNATLKYKIISEQADSPFKINEKTGNIHLIRSIDYENDNHLYISICQVSDGEFKSITTLYFNLIPVNDNSPLFERSYYKFIVNDTQSVNSELFCLKAKDEDNDRLIYKMHENDEKEYQVFDEQLEEFYFEVNGESGCVRLMKPFNVEQKDHFQFIVSVTDQQYHDFASVQVQVIKTDLLSTIKVSKNFKKNQTTSMDQILLNDQSIQNITSIDRLIQFERTQYNLSLFEDHKLSKTIVELNLLNFDRNDELNLQIIAGNQNEQFMLNRNHLLLTRSLNYEQVKRYELKVKATNQKNNKSTSTNIQINVMNVANKRPVFLDTPYRFKWCENTLGELGKLIAKSDSSISNLKYLLKNNEFNYFSLDTNTGVLNVIKQIDREALQSAIVELKVLVFDELQAHLQNEAIVSIEILNLNDNYPKWTKSKYQISLNEQVNYAKGQSLLNLTAHDLDGDQLKYRIVNSKTDKFSLNQSTGELYLDEAITFDRELESEYNLIVEADDGEHRVNCTVRIEILDFNDNPPLLDAQTLSNLIQKQRIAVDHLKVTIPMQYFTSDSYMTENEQLFLFGINSFDLDQWNTQNSKINFKLSQSTNSSLLKLNKENGVLTIQNSLAIHNGQMAFEQNRPLKLEIIMQDCNAKNSLESRTQLDLEFYDLSTLKWMTIFEPLINELQVSESTPIKSVIYEFKVLKHLNLTNAINLQIVGGDYDKRFRIVEENSKFKLVLDKSLNYEHVSNYLIYLEATTLNRTNFQILELSIRLLNEDENAPQFTAEVYNVTILEEQEANLFVIKLEAFDLDNQVNNANKIVELTDEDEFDENVNGEKVNEFKFELLTENVPFRIDHNSGAVYTTERIDRETTGDLFELIVQVQDNRALSAQAKLNVHIRDLNDNPPRFRTLFRANVSESTQIGAFIIQITFTDRDKSTNITHKFSISDNRFTIDQYTGKVYLAQQLDCDFGSDEIEAIVTVNDGEWNQDTILTVHILDENDQVPKIQDCRNYFRPTQTDIETMDEQAICVQQFELNENKPLIGRIRAIDYDKGMNALISYQFAEESDLFRIDRRTGEIWKLENYSQLKYKPLFHTIKVQACDNGVLPQCSHAKIYLTSHQNAPFVNIPIPVDLPNGTVIYSNKANSVDLDGFGFCDKPLFTYANQSLVLSGKAELGKVIKCQFWSFFEREKFTNLKIIITKRNLFEPQFLTFGANHQLVLNETNESFIGRKQVYEFKATDHDSNDGYNSAITFDLKLIDVKYNPNAIQYYFHKLKNDGEDEHFFTKSIEWLLMNNNSTKHYLNPFTLESRTGILYLDHHLDFELITSYKYQISITDNALFDQKSSSQSFNIYVSNLDDNLPLFQSGNQLANQLNLSIQENNSINQVIEKLSIQDFDDFKCCSMKDFQILQSPDSHHFELDESGNLRALKSFDYETKSSYEIALPQNLNIKISVLDQIEIRPKFTKKQFEFNLLEQTKLGTIISNLNHTIQSNESSQYEFQLLKPIKFGIDLGANNDLIVSDEIDFESFSQNEIYKQTQQDNVSISVIKLKFSLLVKAKGQLVTSPDDFDKTELLINLIDLNEPPKFERSTIDCLLVRTNGQCTYQLVNECRALAIDLDQNDSIHYKLLNHNHLFTIDEQKGTISLINCNLTNLLLNLPPDHNSLDVMAIDSNELYTRLKINIKLNWRSRVVEPTIYTNMNEMQFAQNATIDRTMINKWCSKGKLVPETTDRMICYRKTVDHYCCECRESYQGLGDCAFENLCSNNDCENGGLCKQINARERVCLCRKEFRGARCEQTLNQLCIGEKASKCGVNGICEIVKPFGTPRCNCLDDHTFGHECNSFSLGIRPFAYMRLNVSLNEVNDELSMTFASFYRMNNQQQQTGDDFGQLMLYNQGQPNMHTGRTDFIAMELYERYLLLRMGGSHQSKFVELKVYANKHDLLDGRYYRFSLIRNRKIAHISIYSCSRMYLDNQLNCNNLLNQSSISYHQASFHFGGNPLFIGGLDYAYGSNKIFAQKTNGHVLAKSNFVGCLYKATMNGVKINEYIAEKSFVDPICRPSLIHEQTTNVQVSAIPPGQQIKSTDQDLSVKADCYSHCGKESVYCKQNWFEKKCGCAMQINNHTNIVYESGQSCNSLCELQVNKKSVVKLKLSEKWSTIMKSQTYQTRLEEFVLRLYPTSYASGYSTLWTNGYLSIRVSSNGTLYMAYLINEDDQFEQMIKLMGKLKLNQWNTFIIKSTGEQYINDQLNRFNPQLFKSNLKSLVIGTDLVACISHIIINGHLVLNNEHLYELHTENVNGFGCKSMFEFSKLSLDAISIGIILIIMFFVILLLVISTSCMLFNNSSKTPATQVRSSTMGKHFQPTNKTLTPHHSLTQMLNNSYSSRDYEEPFYYGSDYFQRNEKLASANQFNLSNRSQF